MNEQDIIRMAREQVCGGLEPQTPYERGAVAHFTAFGRRVLRANWRETWTSTPDIVIVRQSQLDALEIQVRDLVGKIERGGDLVYALLTRSKSIESFLEKVCDQYARWRADDYCNAQEILHDLALEAGKILGKPESWWR